MGEVYRARDTKLGRDVAIKILPHLFSNDPERLARFEREARTLASLNHPHIGAIYGVEDQDGVRGLVLELVEGETLADRLQRGSLPISDSLTIARQIADALDAAHEKGIIHRDLKPANIKITPDGVVKVLDFGLAKAAGGDDSTPDLSQSPTVMAGGTRDGIILGTAGYMSPEQARGRPVDKRADLWAFGAVLYEMVTGRRAFAGEGVSDTLAHVLMKEPDWTALPADTPAPIRNLLRRCLEKNRKRRFESAADARLEIDDALASPSAGTLAGASAPSRRVAPVAIAALAGGAGIAALVTWVMMRPAPLATAAPARFAIVVPPAQSLNASGVTRDLAVSPDGRHMVYRAGGTVTAGSPLMVRAIDHLDAVPLAGVDGAYAPFFSPDGKWIGFFANTELRKASIEHGPIVTLCQFSGAPLGASWSQDNTITFATSDPASGLWRVSADGGEPIAVTTPDAAQHEGDHTFPSMLPRGRGVLYTIAAPGQSDNSQIAVLDLQTGQRRTLIHGGSDAEYLPTGHLLFAAAGGLRLVPFDLRRLAVLGDPVTVVEHVMTKSSGAANYAVSQAGTLVYVPGATGPQTTLESLVWVDRKGHEDSTNAPLRSYGPPRLSPDGTRVAISIRDQGLWIWELARETLTRLTFDPVSDSMPVWTPDGTRIVFMSTRAGPPNLYVHAADGTGTVDRLTTSTTSQWSTSITPDGTRVVGFEIAPKTPPHVILLPLAGPASQTLFDGSFAEISPDGRYVAYQTNGPHSEVYVRSFPLVDSGRWQISTGGGTRPAWARSGRELFYLDESETLTAVPVQTSGSTFTAGHPSKVFDTRYAEPNPARHYDVSRDGQKFLMIKNAPADQRVAPAATMVVVLNWFEELKARMPAGT